MKKNIIYLFLLYTISLLIAVYLRFPEVDEIGTADSSINFVNGMGWTSHVWQYSYHPLHRYLLVFWLSLFGISHFTVCGFNVFLGAISCFVFLQKMQKYKIVKDNYQSLLCIVLFWSFNTFTDVETFGRIDNLIMLMSILTVDCLLSDSRYNGLKITISSFFLMLAGIYEMPIFVVSLVIVSIFHSHNKDELFRWLKKTACFFIGIILAFLSICIYYYYSDGLTLLEYLATLFAFNANVTQKINLTTRLTQGYSNNIFSILIFSIHLLWILLNRKYKAVILGMFILSIPSIMVLSGRYEPYYSWLFYIPLIIYILTFYSFNKILTLFTILLLLLCNFISAYREYKHYDILNIESIRIDTILKEHSALLNRYDNIIITNELIYYHIVEMNKNIYYFFNGKINEKDYGNFTEKLEYIDQETKGTFHRLLVDYYLHNPIRKVLPESGVFVSTREEHESMILSRLSTSGYEYQYLISIDNFRIIEFNKRID